MRFSILGSIEAWRDGDPVSIGGPKQRALLAVLLLHANRPLARDRLIEALWGESPPPSAQQSLDAYLSRLRRQLGGERVIRRPPGYLLEVGAGELDADLFEEHVRAGRAQLAAGHPREAAALLRTGLALWRGPALADVLDEPFARAESSELEERRLGALEDRIEADLETGDGADLLAEMERLVREHPLRERLIGQLMVCLYAAGRQAEALTVFQAARHRLVGELGIDPGPQLRDLEGRILRQDLALPPGAAAAFSSNPPMTVTVQRWTPVRVAAVAVGVIIVLAALVALATTRAGGAHRPTSLRANVVGILDASGHIVGQVPLGGRPGGVAAGAGSMWATNTEHDALVQIDPAGRIVDTIHVGADPTGVAVGGGGVWVADSGGRTVSWINSATPSDRLPTLIDVGQAPGPIAYGERAAWVVNTTDGTLQRIDSRSLKASRPIAIGGALAAVTVGGGWVWVTDTSSSSIVRVDPDTFQVIRLPVGNNPVSVAFGAGRVWTANAADGTVTRLNPATNQKTEITVGRSPNGLAYANDAVFVAVGQPPSVARIDAGSLHVTSGRVASLPQAVAVSGDRTWVTALGSPTSHRGGTLRIVFSNDHFRLTSYRSPFDPATPTSPDEVQQLSLTNDGLVTYRRAGDAAGVQVVPDLAVAMPTVSNGGLTYAFQLRRDIRYSNGRRVRASDFRYAVERQFLPGVLDKGYGGTFQQELFSSLVGYRVCAQPPHTCHLAKAIQTDDETGTVTLHLSRPDPALPEKLATTLGDLVPPGSPPPGSGRPVPATGPYMIAGTQKPGRYGFVMVRNPYFRQWSADAQPAGYPNQLRWSHVKDTSSELTAVERGTADVMIDQPPTNRLRWLQTRNAALLHPYTQLATTYLALNTRISPFNRLPVRRAVNLAVDRRRVVKLFGGPQVHAPTCQILPTGMFGYTPYCPYTAKPSPSGAWSAPDVAQARRLVRASGTRGTQVTLWVCGGESTGNLLVTRYLRSVLEQIGYDASVHNEATNCVKFFATVAGSRNHVQASVGGWGADYPSPIAFFDVLLTCNAYIPNSTANLNFSEFCDPRLDSLVRAAEAAQTADPSRALQRWQEADHEAVNHAPWVPLTNPRGLDVVSSRVGDYQHNPQWGTLLDQLWVK